MQTYSREIPSKNSGFSLIELLIVIFIFSILTTITSPYAIKWLRRQQTTSYLNEVKEFIGLVRGEARRWSASCEILLSEEINHGHSLPFKVNCISENDSVGNIRLIQPAPPRDNFLSLNQKFLINPRGKVVGESPIIFVFGFFNGSKKEDQMFCLLIDPINSLIKEGNFHIEESEKLVIAPDYAFNLDKTMCK